MTDRLASIAGGPARAMPEEMAEAVMAALGPDLVSISEAEPIKVTVQTGGGKPGGGAPPSAAGGTAAGGADPSKALVPTPPQSIAKPTPILIDRDSLGLDDEVDGEAIDLTAPVDWYIDIDWPPIVQKAPDTYMTALKALSEMLPGGREGKRLVLSMALNALGVNNVDDELDRVFAAADLEALTNPQPDPAAAATGQPGAPGKPPQFGGPQPGQQPGHPGQPPAFGESTVRDMLTAVREAVAAHGRL